MRLALRTVAALAAAVVALSVTAVPASAAATVEVEPGWAGTYDPGVPVPVRVRVGADALVRGELRVSWVDRPESATVSMPVEVPGGSTKEHVVILPAALGRAPAEVRATLTSPDAGGDEVASGSAGIDAPADVEVVGLLPGALAGRPVPGPAPLAVDVGTARFAAVTADDLADESRLGGIDVLAAAPGELAALGEPARRAVLQWVELSGGRLLVDEPAGAEVPGLPPGFQPGGDGRVAVGLGEVRAVGGVVAAGSWSGVVEPTPLDRGGLDQFLFEGSVAADLSDDAGLALPEIGWLVGFLVAYVLGAVPVTLTVLRRTGRAEWGWFAVPAIAVAFTAAGYVAGRDARSDVTVAHGTTLHTAQGGTVARVAVARLEHDGRADVGFPAGWVVPGADVLHTMRSSTLRHTGSGTVVGRGAGPGEFVVHVAEGGTEVGGRLEVVVQSAEGPVLRGVVRNSLPFALDEVVVGQGLATTRVGLVDAGAEAPWELTLHGPGDPWMSPMPATWAPEAQGRDGVVSIAIWEEVGRRAPSGAASPGYVTASGWTREYRPPIEVGDAEVRGRTLVVGSTAVALPSFHPMGVSTSKVRSPVVTDEFGGWSADGSPLVIRYALPDPDTTPPVDTSALVARAPEGTPLELWRPGGWELLEPSGPAPAANLPTGGQQVDHPLPSDAAVDGVVWLRVNLSANPAVGATLASALDLVTLEAAP